MTKSEIKNILAIIPKTGNPDIDDNMEKAKNSIDCGGPTMVDIESHSEKIH